MCRREISEGVVLINNEYENALHAITCQLRFTSKMFNLGYCVTKEGICTFSYIKIFFFAKNVFSIILICFAHVNICIEHGG